MRPTDKSRAKATAYLKDNKWVTNNSVNPQATHEKYGTVGFSKIPFPANCGAHVISGIMRGNALFEKECAKAFRMLLELNRSSFTICTLSEKYQQPFIDFLLKAGLKETKKMKYPGAHNFVGGGTSNTYIHVLFLT